jgi:thioester reductase-like protein
VPVTERPILLTGATGFVGMAVLARLLAAGHEVHCLIRASDDAEADSRLRAVLQRVEAPSTGRAVAIAGDLTAPRLGLGDRHNELAGRVSTVIHSAASVAFDLPIEEARAINVEGTRRVLDFATAVPGLRRVAYVSTAYVAGDRRGTV